jgi:hypothetical protein
VVYSVTLKDGNKSIIVDSTRTPIVVTVPEGDWDVEVRADGEEGDDFAATSLRFLGKAKIKVNGKEEKVVIDTSIMTPAIQVETWNQITRAFNGSWDNYLKEVGWKQNSKPQKYYIELINDSNNGLTANSPITLNGDSNKNVVLWTDVSWTDTAKPTITKSILDPLFRINKGTLTLGGTGDGKIIIKGNDTANNDSLITVSGNLIMNKGVTLNGNTTAAPHPPDGTIGGGGVYIGTGGSFTMNDGTISGNTTSGHGGGVRVWNGTFTMNGGTISGNTANIGGGVRVSTSATFYMYGGTISNNIATKSGGGSEVSYLPGTYHYIKGTITNDNPSVSKEVQENGQ